MKIPGGRYGVIKTKIIKYRNICNNQQNVRNVDNDLGLIIHLILIIYTLAVEFLLFSMPIWILVSLLDMER